MRRKEKLISLNSINLARNNMLKLFLSFLFIFILLFNLFAPTVFASSSFAKNNYSKAVMSSDGTFYIRENLEKRIYPASITKIAIGIISIEKLKLDDEIQIKKLEYTLPKDYVETPLYIGEKLRVEDLLYANMLKSGNDASLQLAYEVYGSLDKFITEANNYLKDLGLKDTHFNNPFGLQDNNHYTTPYDILLLTKYAMKNETFKKIVSASSYIIPENNYSNQRIMRTTSLFATESSSLYNKNFYGVKTGYTEEAGDCFVSAAMINNKEYYFLYTGANSREAKFKEIAKMYNEMKFLLNQKELIDDYSKTKIQVKNSKFKNINYLYAKYLFTDEDKVLAALFLITFLILFIKIKPKKKTKKRRKR